MVGSAQLGSAHAGSWLDRLSSARLMPAQAGSGGGWDSPWIAVAHLGLLLDYCWITLDNTGLLFINQPYIWLRLGLRWVGVGLR